MQDRINAPHKLPAADKAEDEDAAGDERDNDRDGNFPGEDE